MQYVMAYISLSPLSTPVKPSGRTAFCKVLHKHALSSPPLNGFIIIGAGHSPLLMIQIPADPVNLFIRVQTPSIYMPGHRCHMRQHRQDFMHHET